ncbi:MAG: hypothetical protein ACK56F_05755 [bacterium]
MRNRQCYACGRTKCQPGPARPPNPLAYHTSLPYTLTITVYGNSHESSQAGRASMSAWLGGLGGFVRMGF